MGEQNVDVTMETGVIIGTFGYGAWKRLHIVDL